MTHHKLENPDGSRVDFNEISLESLGCHLLCGDVNAETMKEAITFIIKANQIFKEARDVTLFLNSSGGDIYDGFALIDIMNVSRLPVKTVGLGNIMSMGVLILCAGEKGKRIMTKNTQVMAHQFLSGIEGVKFHELVTAHKADVYLHHQFLNHYKTHTKMTEKQIKDILFNPSDIWLTPADCKKYGLVDHVIDELPDFNLIPALPLVRPTPQPLAKKSVKSTKK